MPHLIWKRKLSHLHKAVKLDPEFALMYWSLGAVHGYTGMPTRPSRRSVWRTLESTPPKQLEEASRQRYVSPLDRAICLAGVGNYEEAFAWLERRLMIA